MGKIIIAASGKGGTGKTTAVANIGASLAESGKLVAVVDMDIGCRNLDIALGLESSIVYDIFDVIDGNCDIDDALIKDNTYNNLYFIPAPQTRNISKPDDDALMMVWDRLRARFDYCIIDAPAGVDGGFLYGAVGADSAVIVTTPEIAALRDGDRAISVLEDMGIDDIRVIINRIKPDLIAKGVMPDMDKCVDILGVPVIGIVPEDDLLTSRSYDGELAISEEESMAGRAFSNIASRIMGNTVPIMDFNEQKSLLSKLKGLFK